MNYLIVDDEPLAIQNLRCSIKDHFDDMELIGTASSVKEAERIIQVSEPDLVFLDIEMPEENGFALLEKFPQRNFSVIFVTAYSNFALQAFRASATDYLLKPLDEEALIAAVEKVRINPFKQTQQAQDKLLQAFIQQKTIDKLAIPSANKHTIVNLDDILYLEADNNYTIVHLADKSKLIASFTLKNFEDVLKGVEAFVRSNKSYIINQMYIKELQQKNGGMVTMTQGSPLPLSKGMYDVLLANLKTHSILLKR